MTDPETRTHGEELKRLISTVVDEDVLTLVDISKIVDICLEAAKRKKAEVTETCLAELIRNPIIGADETGPG